MMGWGVVIAALGVLKELFALIRVKEECKKTKAEKLLAARDALKKSRQGDTSEIESAFGRLALGKPKLPVAKGVVEPKDGAVGTEDPPS